MFETGFPKDWSTLKKLAFLRGSALGGGGSYITLVGDIVRFMASRSAPFRKLQIALEPIQDLNGYDSPWPAGGGKNLCPPISEWTGGYITGQGTISSDTSNGEKTSPLIPVTGGQIYTFSYDLGASISGQYWAAVCFYNSSENPVGSRTTNNAQSAKYDLTATAPANAAFVRVSMRTYTYGSQTEAQVELGASASAYAPYSNICPISGRTSATVYHSGADTSDPTTYTIQLGDTVYGGTLDVTSGKLTVDRVLFTPNGTGTYESFNSVRKSSVTTVNSYYFSSNSIYLDTNGAKDISNVFKYIGASDVAASSDNSFFFYGTQLRFTIPMDSAMQTADDVNAWIASLYSANTPLQFVLELVTPIEITLTPQTINSLVGENNVWDDGTLTVEVKGEAIT